jgi:serine/threonine protein kinase
MLERNKREGEVVKILDFGISKIVADVSLTGAGTVVGTWRYLSPEQARGKGEIDVRSDQYGIAVLLYQCILGVRAFEGDPGAALLNRIVAGDFIKPTKHDPTFNKDLEKVILKAMSVDPANRFPTIAEFARALIPFASPRGQRLSTDRFSDNPSMPLTSSAGNSSKVRLALGRLRQSPFLLVGAGAAALAIAAVIVFVLQSSRPRTTAPAAMFANSTVTQPRHVELPAAPPPVTQSTPPAPVPVAKPALPSTTAGPVEVTAPAPSPPAARQKRSRRNRAQAPMYTPDGVFLPR